MNTFIQKFFALARNAKKNVVRTAAFSLLIAGAFLIGGSMFGGGSMVPIAHASVVGTSTCSVATALSDSVNNLIPSVGDTITYTLTGSYSFTASTTITVNDALGAGLTFVSASTSAGSYASSTGVWNVGMLNGGSTITLTLEAKVDASAAGKTIDNNPSVYYVQSGCTQTSAVTGIPITVQNVPIQYADISVSKTADVTSTTEGSTVHYTITVKDGGTATSTDVVATDILPSSLAFVSATSSEGSYASSTGIWTIGTLSAGSTATLQIATLVKTGTASSTITNTATVTESTSTIDPNLANNSSTVSIPVAPLGSCTLTPAQFESAVASGTIAYGTIVTNVTSTGGTATFTLVNKTNCGAPISLASYEMFESPTSTHWLSTQQLFDSTSSVIGASSTQTFTVNLPVCAAQIDAYYGSAPTKLLDSNPYQYPNVPWALTWAFVRSGQLCGALPSADLTVSKTVDNANPSAGSTVHYTVAVEDLGPATSTGVVATDTLPSGLTFVNATASVGTYASSTGTWNIGTLSASSTATLDIAALVNSGTQGDTIMNTATVGESTSTIDPNLTNNSSSVSITVQSGNGGSPTATLVATKIVCGNVNDLPDLSGSGITIDANTATAFIATHPDCHLASGWDFQWGNASATDPGASFIGVTTSTGWMTAFGPTGSNGQATVQVQNPTTYSKFWMREVQQNGYLAFAYPPVNSTNSAEFFCNTDVKNYDNYEQIDSPQNNATYYCVAWNVPTATTTVPSADISITKTVNNANPSVGDTVNYTLTVAALGPATSTGVVANDILPSGITFVSATSSEGSYASSTGIWTIGTMSASSTATLQIAATVNSGTAGTTIDNTGTVSESTSTIDNNPGNNSSTVSITVQGGGGGGNDADIAITKTVDATSTLPGDTLHYTITAIANGPQASTGVVATDTLPSGLTFVNATTSASTTYDSSTGSWTIGTLLPNATATLQIAATVNATGTAGTTITNQATIAESSTLTDTNTANNIAQATTMVGNASSSNQADLAIVKTVDNANPVTGTDVNFTIVVTNNGPATDSMINGFDQMPAGLATISATTSASTSYNLGTGVWTIGTLAPNATATLAIEAEVSAPAGTVITNTATVSSTLASIIDPNPANNSSSVTLNVQSSGGGCTSNCGGGNTPSAEIGIVKTVDNANPASGSTIHYTLTVNATGPSASFGVVADDILPSGITFVSATSSEGSYASSTGIWTIGTMNNGTNATLTITAMVTAANGTKITNTGTVHESPTVVDPLSGNNSSSVTIDVGGSGGVGQVLGASTSTGQVLGASCGLYLTQYIHPIRKNLNNPTEVKKLQIFLNQNLGLNLPITGYYGNQTIAAVNQFQVKYHTEVLAPWLPLGLPTQFTPTSYVYQTTQRWINLIMCPALNLSLPALKVDMGGE